MKVPALQTPPKFNEGPPKKRKDEISSGREKEKSEISGGPEEGGVQRRVGVQGSGFEVWVQGKGFFDKKIETEQKENEE